MGKNVASRDQEHEDVFRDPIEDAELDGRTDQDITINASARESQSRARNSAKIRSKKRPISLDSDSDSHHARKRKRTRERSIADALVEIQILQSKENFQRVEVDREQRERQFELDREQRERQFELDREQRERPHVEKMAAQEEINLRLKIELARLTKSSE